jgi:energy-coupling factor transporter ATP-binding protein EcfA2
VISLPSLRRLDVDGYGLYPGSPETPGLHVEFRSGLTLALGANGLGKTTLVTMLFRLLTGPSEIPLLSSDGPLSSPRLNVRSLNPIERTTFATRVVDNAVEATAVLVFRLGRAEFTVARHLSTLRLAEWSIDGRAGEADEAAFQDAILEHASLAAFSDWILALRHLVFYFEDRRALVWDASAQRQLLRFLFLPVDQAREWREKEREVMRRDSDVRNATWQYNRENAVVRKARAALAKGSASQLRERLSILTAAQAPEQARLVERQDGLAEYAAQRQDARLAALRADDDYETAARRVERLQLEVIQASFPSASTTARYVLGQILAETTCLVCATEVPAFRAEVEDRLRMARCPVCASQVRAAPSDGVAAAAALTDAVEQVRLFREQRDAAARRRAETEQAYATELDEVAVLDAQVARRAADISEILGRLPAAEQDVQAQQNELAAAGARLAEARRELAVWRAQFEDFVRGVSADIANRKDAIKEAFDAYARAFLVETAALVWEPRRDRVGQGGPLVEFPAFALDLSANTFASPVRRTGPDSVSESQREFIDLSFRMALMEVATDGGATLVVDAPESSIDAVFASRAADVLALFASRDENRLLVTSNLVDGSLIPDLLARAGISSPEDPRVVDLLELASPTAATRQFADDYKQAKARVFGRAALS